MTNTKLLRQKIDESGYKLSFIADQLGLSYGGLQNKLEGKTEFKIPEAKGLHDILGLTDEEMNVIFFDGVVD